MLKKAKTEQSPTYAHRLSVPITDAMHHRLEQIALQRDEAKAELVRTALRAYLDDQEDVIGSRRHFTKQFGRRMDAVEQLLTVAFCTNLKTLHLLHQRMQKAPTDLSELLGDLVEEGVAVQDVIAEMIEQQTVLLKNKPPAT